MQKMLVQLYMEANHVPEPFVDLSGILRDAKTGLRISDDDGIEEEDENSVRKYYGLIRLSNAYIPQS
jgi:carnitine O-acetyltransferase